MYATALVTLRLATLVALFFSGATAWDYYGPSTSFCQDGAGCGDVHAWSAQIGLDLVLPAFGLAFYGALLAASLWASLRVRRLAWLASMVGGLGALGFVFVQKFVIGAWCWLCLGVDSAAIVAALAGAALWRSPITHDRTARHWRVWMAAALLAVVMPNVWGATSPSRDVPAIIRALYDDRNTSVVVMSDPECPYCRLLHSALDEAIDEASDAGVNVTLQYVLVPLPFHTFAREASRAVLCAEDAGQGDAMRNYVYTSDALARDALLAQAVQLGLDVSGFTACIDRPATDARLVANEELADAAGMLGLPTVWIGDHTIVGFDARRGAEPYVEAMRAASQRRGPARPWLPLVIAAILSIAIPMALPQSKRRKPT